MHREIHTKENLSVGVVAHSKYYLEYRDSCSVALNNSGWRAYSCSEIESARSHDVIIVVGMAFFNRVPYLKGNTLVGIQGEHLPLPGDRDWSLKRNLKRYRSMARYYDLVIEWSPANYLNFTCPSPRQFIPYGAPEASKTRKTENWDVVFLGNPYGGKGRRIPVLERLKKECNLCPVREAWGEEKFQLINSAKICLNLHQFESFSFESPRIFELLSEGTFVLTEKIYNSFPFIDGIHFISFENEEDLIKKVHFYCDHPEDRESIAKNGKQKADAYRQEQMFEKLSIEMIHAMKNRSDEWARKFKWLSGYLGNVYIEFFDWLAHFKNRLIKGKY